ncbi:hypothetical protein BASA81_004093 [Batrachochytrium salamandrivorans]|nr:hypothetical protein BASA81_004093 [Batrachochytrium salamandrivorans]
MGQPLSDLELLMQLKSQAEVASSADSHMVQPPVRAIDAAKKRAWTANEDALLRTLVQVHGERCWSKIADELKVFSPTSDRIGKQCRDRWCHHLSPELDKNEWTEEEDEKLRLAVDRIGRQWAEISRTVLPKRSDLAIKNRHYARLRRESRRLESGEEGAQSSPPPPSSSTTPSLTPASIFPDSIATTTTTTQQAPWQEERAILLNKIARLEQELKDKS